MQLEGPRPITQLPIEKFMFQYIQAIRKQEQATISTLFLSSSTSLQNKSAKIRFAAWYLELKGLFFME